MLELYMIFARNIFFRFFFWGGGSKCLPNPVCYAYATNPSPTLYQAIYLNC